MDVKDDQSISRGKDCWKMYAVADTRGIHPTRANKGEVHMCVRASGHGRGKSGDDEFLSLCGSDVLSDASCIDTTEPRNRTTCTNELTLA